MKILQHASFGPPEDVLELIEEPDPNPASGQVLAAIEAAPIAPGDLMNIRGEKMMLRDVAQDGDLTVHLPQVPGIEGVARVVAVGDGVEDWSEGDRTALPVQAGAWRSHILIDADQLIRVPEGDTLPLAVLCNRWTALLALTDLVPLEAGDWIMQNAANSDVGQSLIRLAKRHSIKTVNVVRSTASKSELRAAGADAVVVDGPGLADRVQTATGGADIKLALDAVGGEATDRLARSVAFNGVVANYGRMSGEFCKVSTEVLLYSNVIIRGYYAGRPFRLRTQEEQKAVVQEVAKLAAEGSLPVKVAGLIRWSNTKRLSATLPAPAPSARERYCLHRSEGSSGQFPRFGLTRTLRQESLRNGGKPNALVPPRGCRRWYEKSCLSIEAGRHSQRRGQPNHHRQPAQRCLDLRPNGLAPSRGAHRGPRQK